MKLVCLNQFSWVKTCWACTSLQALWACVPAHGTTPEIFPAAAGYLVPWPLELLHQHALRSSDELNSLVTNV